MSFRFFVLWLAAAATLYACSAQGAPQVPLASAAASRHTSPAAVLNLNQQAVAALDAAAFQLKIVLEEARNEVAPRTGSIDGKCKNGIEVFVPDRNGDADSQEYLFFSDAVCTGLVRDIVRTFNPVSSSSENVRVTIAEYTPGGTTPISHRVTNSLFSKATFGRNGYPVVSHGFVRDANITLTTAAGQPLYTYSTEFILGPSAGGNASLCGDSAGYGEAKLAGFSNLIGSSGTSSGSRQGSIKGTIAIGAYFSSAAFSGASFAISNGPKNKQCPIASPAYELKGATLLGNSSGAYSLSFSNVNLTDLSASTSNSNGIDLTIETDVKIFANTPGFLTGTIAHDGSPIATFSVNQFGDGTYDSKSGRKYTLVDWIPVGS